MPRPLITVEGRTRPVGDRKSQRESTGGLTFTRVRGVRRVRPFADVPRIAVEVPSAEESWEERFQEWHNIHGGTRPEYIVYHYLESRKKMRAGIDFIFQSSALGGRQRRGGSVVDFELPFLKIMIRVQGERFHLGSPEVIANDKVQAASLRRLGYVVIDLYAQDLLQAPERVIEQALRGRQVRLRV